MLCEPVLGNISLVIPDNRDIFAIERIIDFCHSIDIHCKSVRGANVD